MSAPGFTPIQLYYSTTASTAPSAGNLANGELAINITDGKLFYKDNGGVVKVLAGTGGTGVVAGSNTQIQFNNNGVFGAAAGLAWDGTYLTANSIKDSALTSGRVPYATTAGLLTDSANLLYSGTDLTVYGITVGRGGGAVSTNTAVGASALASGSLSGGTNTGVGYYALNATTTGANNTAVGNGAMEGNTTGAENASFGSRALRFNTTGNYNSAFGRDALFSNTTASNNTAVGYQAGYNNTTGANNTAHGYQSLTANTTGAQNTAGGYQAGPSITTGNWNTMLGTQAGYYLTTGSQNTFVGASGSGGAGHQVTTGSKNTILGGFNGNQAGLDIRASSGNVVISDGDGNRIITGSNGGTLGLGNGAYSVNGTGITFPATQSASSDANTLDDYEEGTFSANATAITNCSSVSVTSAVYVKIGRQVTCEITGTFTVTAPATNTYFIFDVPFNAQLSAGGCPGQGQYGNVTNNLGLVIDNSSGTSYQYGFWVQSVNNTESGVGKAFSLGLTYIAAA